MKTVIKGAGYILAHTPDMVLHNGTTQTTERIVNPDSEYLKELPSHLMGIGGAISGCGPAFCALVIEALADAGVKYGLPRDAAYLLASQTLSGTGRMQIETGMHPGAIKDGVCSPAGTTIRGVEALERAGLRAAMLDAVQAVMEKKA